MARLASRIRWILLVDEPTASLDELEEKRVYEFLKEETGITVVVISHDLSVVYRYATMVLCIGKGKPYIGPAFGECLSCARFVRYILLAK